MDAGNGLVVVRRHGSGVVFSELSSTYPLKLLSPRIEQEGVAILYLLTYGGGLVGGDSVSLTVDVGSSVTLVFLTQGSTKVFKTRYEARAARPHPRSTGLRQPDETSRAATKKLDAPITQQHMNVTISKGGALFLLPDPVTCFRSASYNQTQTFRLSDDTASLVVLDWFTSGRRSLGEEWAFSRYYSVNDVWVGGRRVAKDVVLLEDAELPGGGGGGTVTLSRRTLMDKMAPYSCYAMLILCGPLVRNVVEDLTGRYESITVFKTNAPASLIWSLSALDEGKRACVVRVAGTTTEGVKSWLDDSLKRLEDVVGIDTFRRAFA